MSISVTVKDLQTGDPAWHAVLPEPIATIGRSAECDLVLQDTERHVSRQHATIELRADGYYLIVTSTNYPLTLNGLLYQPNAAVALNDGAVIGIHAFEVAVHIDMIGARRENAAWPSRPQPEAMLADPFGLGLNLGRPAPSVPQLCDPFRREAPPPSLLLVDGVDDAPVAVVPVSLDPLALLADPNAHPGQFNAFINVNSVCAPLVELDAYQHQPGSPSLDHVHDFNLPFSAPTYSSARCGTWSAVSRSRQ